MRFKLKNMIATAVAIAVCLFSVGCSSGRTPDISPHLIAEAEQAPVRPIDDREGVALSALPESMTDADYRERISELYSIVAYDKKRPVFDGENDPAKAVYDGARAVLDRYVLNEWHGTADGEYNIVHAVHDYLVCNVDYDFDLYDRFKDGESELESDPAFHIDGAFIDKTAVCDGLARAFVFLCAIEGIDAVRVTGSLASVPHAWNKVKIGGEWYNADVTADAAHYTVGGKRYKQLSHGYFLVSDRTIAEFKPQTHVFAVQPYTALADFDYYADKSVEIDGKTYSLTVKSYAELEQLFRAIKRAGDIGKIELELKYPEKVQVNYADLYKRDIERAYGAFGNTDFGFSDGGAPYFRYPNGVYLFLFYK